MSGFIVLACLAILNGNFWAAVYIHKTYVHTYLHTYIPTYIHIHIHIHIYIHTCTCMHAHIHFRIEKRQFVLICWMTIWIQSHQKRFLCIGKSTPYTFGIKMRSCCFSPFWHYLTYMYACVCVWIWIITTKTMHQGYPQQRVQWQCESILGTQELKPRGLWALICGVVVLNPHTYRQSQFVNKAMLW